MYLFGGWDGDRYVSLALVYNPGEDLWQRLPDMPTPRGYSGAGTAGGRIYVVGGRNDDGGMAVVEVFSPDSEGGEGEAWSTADPMPEARYSMGVTSLADAVYVLGGESGATGEDTGLVYYTHTAEWQVFPTIDSSLGSGVGLSGLGPFLYVMGGTMDGKSSNENFEYQAIFTLSVPVIAK